MRTLFLYGLFMDVSQLTANGLEPEVVGRGRLDGYQLLIGEKATLVQQANHCAYGMLIALSRPHELTLYSSPGVSGYAPESVRVTNLDRDGEEDAVVYNLALDQLNQVPKAEYARALAEVVSGLGFSQSYVDEILEKGIASS